MKNLLVVIALLASFNSAARADDSNSSRGLLQIYNYGWDVSIRINNRLISINKVPGAQTMQLFDANNPIRKNSAGNRGIFFAFGRDKIM